MFIPYYFLNIGATIVLCWLASVGVVSPIRRIAASIARFGHGDLSVRVHTKRKDEIGQLGNSFNQMAERLQRMIASERRLLADISHELRSPLARLKFAVKLAKHRQILMLRSIESTAMWIECLAGGGDRGDHAGGR